MIGTVGVVGLGLMGRSICVCLLRAGHHVVVYDHDVERLEVNKAEILALLSGNLSAENFEDTFGKLEFVSKLEDLVKAELLLESIGEDLDAKSTLIHRLERILGEDVIIGSNTSAIPISDLQKGMKFPKRLLGVHWGDPAHISPFMEIILGDHSSETNAEVVLNLSSKWGKDPILVKKDVNGFIANRLMYALFREAIHLYENGYASIKDIDKACMNDMGLWMGFAGPFTYMELTGVKNYAKVMDNLFPDLSTMKEIPTNLKALMNQDRVQLNSSFYRRSPEVLQELEKKFMDFSADIKTLTDQYK